MTSTYPINDVRSARGWRPPVGDPTPLQQALKRLTLSLSAWYRRSDKPNSLQLLDDIESLRGFCLSREEIKRALSLDSPFSEDSIGRDLCKALYEVITEVDSALEELEGDRRVALTRETRRGIASLNFLGRINPNFL